MEAAKKRPTSISLTGKIVEDRGSEIRVAIRMTNRAFIQYRNTTQTIDIDNALCFKWVSETKSETLDCDEDLGEDDTVAVIARVTRTDSGNVIFTARRVQLKQPRIQIP